MTLDLAAIRARLAARTPGDWFVTRLSIRGRIYWYVQADSVRTVCQINGPATVRPAEQLGPDAEFIARAPEDIAALLAEVGRLEAIRVQQGVVIANLAGALPTTVPLRPDAALTPDEVG